MSGKSGLAKSLGQVRRAEELIVKSCIFNSLEMVRHLMRSPLVDEEYVGT